MIKFFNYFFEGEEKKKMKLADNVPSIADGGALNHRSLINNQKFKICKQNH